MNALLKSLLLALANAALQWLIELDQSDTVIDFLRTKLDEYGSPES